MMFNQNSSMFGNSNANSGLFQAQPSFFTQQTRGTTVKFNAVASQDNVQKNGVSTTVNTKLQCITSMKEYETKSLEELRFEDYHDNRVTVTKPVGSSFFASSQSTQQFFNPQTSLQSNAFGGGSNQAQSTFGGANQSSFFGNTNNQQTRTSFGGAAGSGLFGAQTTATSSAFGTFNNQSKPSLFGSPNTSATNKPLFGANSTNAGGSVFGASQQQSQTTNFFSTSQPVQSTGLFGGIQSQQQQPQQNAGGLFGNTTNFGFQTSQPQAGLFGAATTSKPFSFTNNTSTPNQLFSNTSTSGSNIFGGFQQPNANTSFGSSVKPNAFPTVNTFGTTPVSTQNQPSLFNQNATTLFGQKSSQAPTFGSNNLFNNTATKPGSLFGNTQQTAGGFGTQTSVFGGAGFGTSAQSVGGVSSAISAVPSNMTQIGIGNQAEAISQQQKLLSLISSRPYGVNKLFLSPKSNDKCVMSDGNGPNTSILSEAIKRNDNDKFGQYARRRVLKASNAKITNPCKIFSGFDDYDNDYDNTSTTTKAINLEKAFFTKRECWTYLPPSALEKSRKSINSNNSICNNDSSFLSIDKFKTEASVQSFCDRPVKEINKNNCSTPVTESKSNRQIDLQLFSPIKDDLVECRNAIQNEEIEQIKQNDSNIIRGNDPDCVDFSDDGVFIVPKSAETKRVKFADNVVSVTNSNNVQKQRCCGVKLTKPDYYIEPQMEKLDELISVNDHNEPECWVENFIIGRKGFGSIRFPGWTNVYGINLDKAVIIEHKEVTVYPNEGDKPEIDDGLNKLAQVILHRVWPVDKSTNEDICDVTRLEEMNFEEKLKKCTARLNAKFLRYIAASGTWQFEVAHFSKYRFTESDDDDNDNGMTTKENNNDNLRKTHIKSLKNEEFKVVSAEADSMTSIGDDFDKEERSVSSVSLLGQHSSNRNNRNNLFKFGGVLQSYDSDYDDDSVSENFSGLFQFGRKSHSKFLKSSNYDHDEPFPKKFESMEIGEQILNGDKSKLEVSMGNASRFLGPSQQPIGEILLYKTVDDYCDDDCLKPITPECLASTVRVMDEKLLECSMLTHFVEIPSYLRDFKSYSSLYLPTRIGKYLGVSEADIHKKYVLETAFCTDNRFRASMHSTIPGLPGLHVFVRNDPKRTENGPRSFAYFMQKQPSQNSLKLMNLQWHVSDYQMRLLEAARANSQHVEMSGSDCCPFMQPISGIGLLNAYLALNAEQVGPDDSSDERWAFERVITLCHALWGQLSDDGEPGPSWLQDLARKQALSLWIRNQSRRNLVNNVKTLLKASPANADMDRVNDIILNLVCCGEIKMATNLAAYHSQYRLALLIAQCGGSSLHTRDLFREQLQLWHMNRVDVHMPRNVLSIYLLLSGQTQMTLSDGTVLAPLKRLNWIQTFGCFFWYVQPYGASIASTVDIYDEESSDDDADVASPYPFLMIGEGECMDTIRIGDYPYQDSCYHLIKLFCNQLHDIDKLLDPPAMGRHDRYRLARDWAATWHLSSVLVALECSNSVQCYRDKISAEYAAQLERAGQWTEAAFVLTHISNNDNRVALLRSLIGRHATIECKDLSAAERWLVDILLVPCQWIHEAKAIRCKYVGNTEMEAFHWFRAGHYETAHRLYVDGVLPGLLINDKFRQLKIILEQFTENGDSRCRSFSDWEKGGEMYVRYLSVSSDIKTLGLTKRLTDHSLIFDNDISISGTSITVAQVSTLTDPDEIEFKLRRLQMDVTKLLADIESFDVSSNEKIICKSQMATVCHNFLDACHATEVY